MRLWSLHPSYLDAKGLVALWREGLLARMVLQGNTKGYRNHPQLNRFRLQKNPLEAIEMYLYEVLTEANRRGYHFDANKIKIPSRAIKIPVTEGQIAYEFSHLMSKLKVRDVDAYKKLRAESVPLTHPVFVKIKGDVESWEVVPANG